MLSNPNCNITPSLAFSLGWEASFLSMYNSSGRRSQRQSRPKEYKSCLFAWSTANPRGSHSGAFQGFDRGRYTTSSLRDNEENPKSATFADILSSFSRNTSTFAGFRSPCAMPCKKSACIYHAICTKITDHKSAWSLMRWQRVRKAASYLQRSFLAPIATL